MQLIRKLLFFITLVLVQVLVCNNIHLFDYAVPLLYVYFYLTFSRNYPRWAVLLWCFAMGLTQDSFANTPGVATAASTLIGFLQPYIFSLFIQRDSQEELQPTLRSMGFGKYSFYAFLLILLYCIAFFSLEMFSFFNWMEWLFSIGGSFILTYILILTIENFKK